jgi:hypothetical protein
MKLNFFDNIGNLNPQFLREIKGRIKILPILLTVVVSIAAQGFIFFSNLQSYPTSSESIGSKYCDARVVYQKKVKELNSTYSTAQNKLQQDLNYYSAKKTFDAIKVKDIKQKIQESKDNYNKSPLIRKRLCPENKINTQLWWQDSLGKIFKILNQGLIYGFIVGGIYLLVNDLSKENRQGSLNFIRLTPQSAKSVILGKILGVPILIYLGFLLALPLQFMTGISSQVPLIHIIGFDVVLIANGIFFYSAAFLFGLVTPWLSGFQPWLASGTVVSFLMWTQTNNLASNSSYGSFNFISLFNPYILIPGVTKYETWRNFQWFGIPIGSTQILLVLFSIGIYLILSSFIWQSLGRCFNNVEANILSKKTSYLLTTCFTVIILGAASWGRLIFGLKDNSYMYQKNYEILYNNFQSIIFLHLVLFLYLIAALTPQRQALQDWMRYRRFSSKKSWFDKQLLQDLLWHEKSPSLLAFSVNVMISITILGLFTLASRLSMTAILHSFTALAFAAALAILYATVVQLAMFMENKNRIFWAIGSLTTVMVLPVVILVLFSNILNHHPETFLLCIVAPLMSLNNSPQISDFSYLIMFLFYCSAIAGLTFIFTKQLQKAGESETKNMAL